MATITGLNDLLKNFQNIKEAVPVAVASAMGVVTQEIAQEAQQNHYFQNQTGNLEASIQALPVIEKNGEIIGQVKAGMEYAQYVEFGTSKISAKPFLTPAIESNQKNVIDTVVAAIERANKVIKVK